MQLKIIPVGFRQRIILGFSCLIFLFLGVMITVEFFGIPGTSFQGSIVRYRSDTLKDMELVSGLLSQRISDWFAERRIAVELLSGSPFLRRTIETHTLRTGLELAAELNSFIESHSEFESVAIVDLEDGSIRAAGGDFINARITPDIFISPGDLSILTIPGYLEKIDMRTPADNINRLRIIRQVISADKPNKIIALLVAESNINRALRPIVLSVNSQLSRKWQCILASNFGEITTDFSETQTDTRRQNSARSALKTFSPIRLSISGLEGSYDGPDENGMPVLAFHRQVKFDRGIAFALILRMDRSLALQPAWTFILSQIILWLVMFVVGIAACFMIARQISRPLQELVAVARSVESGNLMARAATNTKSEIGLLAAVFNSMIDRLQAWHIDLEQQVLARTREIQEGEQVFKDLFDNMYDGVAVYRADEDGKDFVFVDMNESGERISAVKRENIIGRPVTRIFPGIIEMGLLDVFQRVYRTGKKERFPVSVYHDDRIFLWVDNAVFKLPTNEIVAVYRDETERQKALENLRKRESEILELNRNLENKVSQRTAELEKANKELEDFVYSVSHDLRAPLRSISGFAEIIDRRHKNSLNDEGRHYFENIVKASRQMGTLIDDLLNFSRLGRKAIKLVAVPLDDVFQSALETLSESIKLSGARISLPERMPMIHGDLTLTSHIIINLLENALKYRKPDQSPCIDVCFEMQDRFVVVSIADNGIGIDADYHDKIFNIFQRLHSEAEYPGTGIGLAAVKKAVQIMGGQVRVESETGKGSVFILTFLTATPQ